MNDWPKCPRCDRLLVVNEYYEVAHCPNEQCGISVCLRHHSIYMLPRAPLERPRPLEFECGMCRQDRLAIEAEKESATDVH
jgi:hypothetical protein